MEVKLKVNRQSFSTTDLNDGRAPAWKSIKGTVFPLSPSPIALTEPVSPYLARSTGHGIIETLKVQMAHDGTTLSMRLSWADSEMDGELTDLDQFSDAVSVMFPLSKISTAITMGSPNGPVDCWQMVIMKMVTGL